MINTFGETFARKRIFWSRIFLGALLVFIVFSAPPWPEESYPALVVEILGYVLLVAATLGRLWCATYIAGAKDRTLMQDGPYSVVRNPLYLSNFLGAVGFGLSTENLVATVIILVVFTTFYPFVVRREEKQLATQFADAFADYVRRVPRWWPRLAHYREPETYVVRARMLRRGYFNAMWFMWAFMLWEVIERLRELRAIPIFWGGV